MTRSPWTVGTAAVVLAAALAGCTGTAPGEDPAAEDPAAATIDEAPAAPVIADPVTWDTPITVPAVEGGELELALTGVRYITAEEADTTENNEPSRKLFGVVRYTAAAIGEVPLSLPDMWVWRGEGQEYGRGDGGTATMAPWQGYLPDTWDATLLPGEEPTIGYATVDLPRAGGELTFTDAQGDMVRWTMPEEMVGELPELETWFAERPDKG